VIGTVIIQSVILAAMEKLIARGVEVINLPSANVEGADLAAVSAAFAALRGRIRHL
jgi:uncharacterized phosphosugar-binding protein